MIQYKICSDGEKTFTNTLALYLFIVASSVVKNTDILTWINTY